MKDYFEELLLAEAFIKQQNKVLSNAEITIGVKQSEIDELKYLLSEKDLTIKKLTKANIKLKGKLDRQRKLDISLQEEYYRKQNIALNLRIAELIFKNKGLLNQRIAELNKVEQP